MKSISSSKEFFSNQDYENSSHIARKQKAVDKQYHKKNYRDIVEMINDEDEEVAEKYARFLR